MKPVERLGRQDLEAWERETRRLRPASGCGPVGVPAAPKSADGSGPARRREDVCQDEAWLEFVQDGDSTRKLEPADRSVPPGAAPGPDDGRERTPPVRSRRRPASSSSESHGLDRKTLDRLRRGKLEPADRLDLHGMRYNHAKLAVARFLERSHDAERRLVLVVTGYGSAKLVRASRSAYPTTERTDPEAGVLRRDFPQWLQSDRLTSIVAYSTQAHDRHGGRGAFYVYLKRRR